MPEKASLRAAMQWNTGDISVEYTDESVLHLNRFGTVYHICQAKGPSIQQIVAFATSTYMQKLKEAIFFRTSIFPSAILTPAFVESDKIISKDHDGNQFLDWPQGAMSQVEFSGNAVSVTSLDNTAQVTLAPHARFFEVSCLVQVLSPAALTSTEIVRNRPHKKTWARIYQVFSVNCYPPIYEKPLIMCLAARKDLLARTLAKDQRSAWFAPHRAGGSPIPHSSCMQSVNQYQLVMPEGVERCDVYGHLMASKSNSDKDSDTASEQSASSPVVDDSLLEAMGRVNKKPAPPRDVEPNCDPQPDSVLEPPPPGIVSLMSLDSGYLCRAATVRSTQGGASGRYPVARLKDGVMMRFMPLTSQVEAWTLVDGSYYILSSENRLFCVYTSSEAGVPRVYLLNSVPQVVPGCILSPLEISKSMVFFREMVRRLASSAEDHNEPEPEPVDGNVVVERRVDDDFVGTVYGFGDGRVRIVFRDRTIGTLSRDGKRANLITATGRVLDATLERPVGMQKYFRTLQEAWRQAFMSASDRLEVAEQTDKRMRQAAALDQHLSQVRRYLEQAKVNPRHIGNGNEELLDFRNSDKHK